MTPIPAAAKPYILLGLVIVWIGSLAAVGWWQYDAGKTKERDGWQKRENERLAKANAKIIELEGKVRETERRHAEAMADASKVYQGRLKDADEKRKRDIAAALAGQRKLQFSAPGGRPGGSEACPPGTTASRRDGGTSTELRGAPGSDIQVTLPPKITADLYDLAHDANKVVEQLTACQAIVRADRQIQGQTPP